MIRVSFSMLLPLACLVAACGSGGSSSSTGSPEGAETDAGADSRIVEGDSATPVELSSAEQRDIDTFCTRAYASLMRGYELCCAPSAREFADATYDKKMCQQQLGAMLRHGRLLVNRAGIDLCIGDIERAASSRGLCGMRPRDSFSVARGGADDKNPQIAFGRGRIKSNSCLQVFVGTQREGQTCFMDDECAPGLGCVGFTNGCADGSCEGKEGKCRGPGRPGEQCGGVRPVDQWIGYQAVYGPHPGCESTSFCAQNGSANPDSSCRARSAEGGPCNDNDVDLGCMPGLFCIRGPSDVTGKCQKSLLAKGAPCSTSLGCADGLRCMSEGASYVCDVPLRAAASCSSFTECAGTCDTTSGKCVDVCGSG